MKKSTIDHTKPFPNLLSEAKIRIGEGINNQIEQKLQVSEGRLRIQESHSGKKLSSLSANVKKINTKGPINYPKNPFDDEDDYDDSKNPFGNNEIVNDDNNKQVIMKKVSTNPFGDDDDWIEFN